MPFFEKYFSNMLQPAASLIGISEQRIIIFFSLRIL